MPDDFRPCCTTFEAHTSTCEYDIRYEWWPAGRHWMIVIAAGAEGGGLRIRFCPHCGGRLPGNHTIWRGHVLTPLQAGGDPMFDLGQDDWRHYFDMIHVTETAFEELERASFWERLNRRCKTAFIDMAEEEWVEGTEALAGVEALIGEFLAAYPETTENTRRDLERLQELTATARTRGTPLIFML